MTIVDHDRRPDYRLSRQYKNPVPLKLRHLAAATSTDPVPHPRAPVAGVESFVDDHMRRAGLHERAPRAIGSRSGVLQTSVEQLIVFRRAAAVAVDERLPVKSRVKHVADVERGLA